MSERKEDTSGDNECVISSKDVGIDYTQYKVEELAIASEHAPFKHKNVKGVGMQAKPAKSWIYKVWLYCCLELSSSRDELSKLSAAAVLYE